MKVKVRYEDGEEIIESQARAEANALIEALHHAQWKMLAFKTWRKVVSAEILPPDRNEGEDK